MILTVILTVVLTVIDSNNNNITFLKLESSAPSLLSASPRSFYMFVQTVFLAQTGFLAQNTFFMVLRVPFTARNFNFF